MAILYHQFQRETSQSSSNSLLAGTSQSSSTSLFAEKCKVFKKEPITKYKQLINEAAFELSIETPTLLCDRKALLTSARKRVHDNGMSTKKVNHVLFNLIIEMQINAKRLMHLLALNNCLI